MNEDIFKYKHSKSIAEAENNDLSENIISCHSGVQTVGIRFNPNAEYASGMYLAGTDIPFGFVKILLIGKPSDKTIKLTVIDSTSKEREEFTTKLSGFWVELREGSCVYIRTDTAKDRFNIISSADSIKYSSEELLFSGVYSVGKELTPGQNKIVVNYPETEMFISISDKCSCFSEIHKIHGDTWIELHENEYLLFYSSGRTSISCIPENSLKPYNPNDERKVGTYKIGTDLPAGWVQFLPNRLYYDDFEYSVSEDPFIYNRVTKIGWANAWIYLPAGQYLHVLNIGSSKGFKLINEENVVMFDENKILHKGIYRAGVDLPSGYLRVFIKENAKFTLSVSKDPFAFDKCFNYSGRVAWIKLEKGDFLRINCDKYDCCFTCRTDLIFGHCADFPEVSYYPGIRKVPNEFPAGYVKIFNIKDYSRFKFSISKDPSNFSKYYTSKTSSIWLRLEKDDFIDIQSDDDKSFSYKSENFWLSNIRDNSSYRRGIRKVGCEIPAGRVTITVKHKCEGFSYSVSNDPLVFTEFTNVYSKTITLELELGQFIYFNSEDDDASFSFSLAE